MIVSNGRPVIVSSGHSGVDMGHGRGVVVQEFLRVSTGRALHAPPDALYPIGGIQAQQHVEQ